MRIRPTKILRRLNQITIWLINCPNPHKFGSAYKIFMSVNSFTPRDILNHFRKPLHFFAMGVKVLFHKNPMVKRGGGRVGGATGLPFNALNDGDFCQEGFFRQIVKFCQEGFFLSLFNLYFISFFRLKKFCLNVMRKKCCSTGIFIGITSEPTLHPSRGKFKKKYAEIFNVLKLFKLAIVSRDKVDTLLTKFLMLARIVNRVFL